MKRNGRKMKGKRWTGDKRKERWKGKDKERKKNLRGIERCRYGRRKRERQEEMGET